MSRKGWVGLVLVAAGVALLAGTWTYSARSRTRPFKQLPDRAADLPFTVR